jgi:DNA-binding NarL/FixJ family response regulator
MAKEASIDVPASSASSARILIVDDHPIVRQGLVQMIEREANMTVCGEAESADEALEMARRLKPALVIVDLSLNGKPGLELVKDLRAEAPHIMVLVLSMHDEALWAERVLRAGACGYVMKQEKPRVLMARIRQALRGQTCLSEAMANTLLRKLTRGGRDSAAHAPEDDLGDRELEVLQLLGQGMSTRDIAAAMHISLKTVESHREHIKAKLNLASSDELLRYAILRFLQK